MMLPQSNGPACCDFSHRVIFNLIFKHNKSIASNTIGNYCYSETKCKNRNRNQLLWVTFKAEQLTSLLYFVPFIKEQWNQLHYSDFYTQRRSRRMTNIKTQIWFLMT